MSFLNSRRNIFNVLIFTLLTLPFNFLPSQAASVLASWLLTSDGTLRLRTAPFSKLEAFYQSGSGSIGDRLWIDFPGELSRPRKINGNGPIKEIRLGKPSDGKTRLVIEFKSNVYLRPAQLRLLGKSPLLWELKLVGLKTSGLKSIGEGSLQTSYGNLISQNHQTKYLSKDLEVSSLPYVPRGRFEIILDPGHGGPDTGAVGINGLRETDVVLDISKKVFRLLSEKGVIVRLTRSTEIDLDLTDRVVFANRSAADAFISIHANASRGNRRDVSGIETYFFSGYRGEKLAYKIQKELISVPGGSPDRGVRQNRFYVIRKTNMPAALVEVGFVTGRLDNRLLSTDSYRRQIAFAIAKGILKFLQESY